MCVCVCVCVWQQMCDRDFDRKVKRTALRPLASGVLSRKQALAFLALQLSAGLCILLTLNEASVVLGASSLALVLTYPFFKRVTHFPQLVLGLCFNWGALLGWTAVHAGSGASFAELSASAVAAGLWVS